RCKPIPSVGVCLDSSTACSNAGIVTIKVVEVSTPKLCASIIP
ncbi:conserved hypothetical protein, partial [Listeria marthii FSL S4-120]